MGEPVKKNAVMGEMILITTPLISPAKRVAIIKVALTIGPVMYCEYGNSDLKYWLIIQTANRTAVVVICFVVIFIDSTLSVSM